MGMSTGTNSRFYRLLDMLATPIGTISVVGLLIGVSFGVTGYVQSVVDRIDADHAVFKDAQVRNGYVAMSDIGRLLLVAQTAAVNNEMTPDAAQDFVDAADILWVRTDNFDMVSERGQAFESADTSIAALNRIIEIADAAIAAEFPDHRQLAQDLLVAAEVARRELVIFTDDIRRQGDLVLDQQSLIVRKQQVFMLIAFAVLTIIGGVALSLLRREVLARRAREKAERRVDFLAYFDPLTQLPNRVQFQERLKTMLDAKGPVSLLLFDLDDFKMVNDTYGHAAGDTVLCRVASAIADLTDQNTSISARLAGDEFAMAVATDDLALLADLCERLIETTSAPFVYEGQTLSVGMSIGLAVSTQLNEQIEASVETLTRVTDFALYASKSSGRNRYTVYDSDLERKFLERRAMVEDLPAAIETGLLETYFQPKVNLPSREVYGFEALVRWPRDNRIVPPGEFIAVAEESGVVVDIDRFILNEATQIVQDWNDKTGTEFSISVNLSTLHFGSQRIVTWVQEALWNSELPAHLLTLEITESMEMRDWDQARKIVSELRDLGCKIAIDDFGSGFSSLAYLLTTQADELKIDKTLMDRVEASKEARMLLASVFDIARNLSLDLIVEGIETEAQSTIIHEMGAPRGQGYLFGRPLPHREALCAAEDLKKSSDVISLQGRA